jgi:hypothetical protein
MLQYDENDFTTFNDNLVELNCRYIYELHSSLVFCAVKKLHKNRYSLSIASLEVNFFVHFRHL